MRKNLAKILVSYWPLLAYFLISIIFLLPIIVQSGLPFKYDWAWPIFDLKEFWKHLFDASSLGIFSMPGKYANLILGLPGLVNFPTQLAFKLFLVLIHTLAGYGFYLFINKKIESKTISFIVGLAYAFSSYIFIRTIVGFTYSMIAYAVLPLFLTLFFRPKKGVWLYLLCALYLALIFSQIQAGLLVLLLTTIYLIVSLFGSNRVLAVKNYLLTYLSLAIVTLPWLILSLFNNSSLSTVSGGAVTTLNFIASLPHSFLNIFMLSDHHITTYFFYPLAHNKFFMVGWLVIWLVAFCAVFNKKNRELVMTFIISSLLVLPFIKGPTGFFAQFYVWFYNHFPQIAVFRETYHFEFLYAISLCVLFAFGLDWIWGRLGSSRQSAADSLQKVTKNGKRKTPKGPLTAGAVSHLSASGQRPAAGLLQIALKTLFAGSVLFIIAPYLTFDFAGYFKLQKIPTEYYQLNSFFKENKDYCSKIYYPPGTGFLYFKGDHSDAASNSDILASSLGVPFLTDGASVLNVPSEEMFFRNQLASQFYETGKDDGEFVNLLKEGGIDCVVVRADIESKYFEASNLWREKDNKIYKKWMNPDMLNLAKSKAGLVLDKKFGENVYIFRPEVRGQKLEVVDLQAIDNKLPLTTNGQPLTYLPLPDWATNFAYYKDGWSRGRYDFWRKMIFAELRQDFLYTDLPDSTLSAKIDQRGSYEVWARLLIGGTAGELEVKIQDTPLRQGSEGQARYKIQKDAGEERFVWKKLGDVNVNDGKIEITNITGENAIADIVLVEK